MITPTTDVIDRLTRQERAVLTLVARGWSNARIGQELFLSPRTVESYLYHIFKKFGVASRTEAAIFAWDAGLLAGPNYSGFSQDGEDTSTYP